jgi:transcriptional regulator of arginine metabolism
MSNQRRQQTILGLIRASRISNQRELIEALEGCGFDCNQSTVSRDLGELDIVKRHGHYVQNEDSRRQGYGVTSVRPALGLLVLKCTTGRALALAYAIDRAAINGIAGTIAGLDSVLIALEDASAHEAVAQELKRLYEREKDTLP